MCGIAGLQMQQQSSINHDTLDVLCQALQHRGPDGSAIQVFDQTAFVHTRLAIIDVAHGHQPFQDNNGHRLIVNGEIYNYKELHAEFHDYPFQTQSDCETILPLYLKYGLEFTRYLRGMYAIALYDADQQILILARDPFGIKPLYYTTNENGLAFASEMQALLQINWQAPVIDPDARSELLQLRYNTGEKTLINSIHRVLPGGLLVIKDGRIIKSQHQTALPPSLPPQSYDTPQALQALEQVLSGSVTVHLRSDVPYGLFLSGGLDSATLLKFMTENSEQPIKTYTIGFKDSSVHDECDQARLLADHFKTEHHEYDYTEQDFWRDLPRVVQAVDDPIFDQAMLPTYRLASEAKKDVKVILCGEGGDELLCGYRRYQRARLPWWLGGRVMRQNGTFSKARCSNHHIDNWRHGLEDLKTQVSINKRNDLQIAQVIDCRSWLPNNLLIKLDRCLMAHGIEGRTPFLDPLVAEMCFNLPNSLKIHGGKGKWILRQWLAQNLPLAQPFAKKRGFRVPIEDWIFNKGTVLASLIADQPGISEIFDPCTVKTIFDTQHKKTAYIAWMLLTYALWHQIHIIKKPVVPDVLSVLAS